MRLAGRRNGVSFDMASAILVFGSACLVCTQMPPASAGQSTTQHFEEVCSADMPLGSEDDVDCALSLIQHSAVVQKRSTLEQKGTAFTTGKKDESLADKFLGGQEHPFLRNQLPRRFANVGLYVTWAACSFYTVCAIWDISKLVRTSRAQANASPKAKAEGAKSSLREYIVESVKNDDEQWSSLGIWMLCFYRLYTGFLAATWLPYVLAMEGEYFWPNNQSLFMGIAKLIYGVTVLLNPMFGLLGDMLAEVCQGAARRLWILLGITLSAFGIMICLWAGPRLYFATYMLGITLWRTGEALNDVTTEAIVPEMVSTRQFALASSIKAASFLMGGLLGYVMVFFMANVHYTWCYFAYLGSMFFCAIPSLLLLVNDEPTPPNPYRQDQSFSASMMQAYIVPCTFDGGFPQISLAIFVMSCGTAPMFFFLLIIRDLVGVHGEATQQRDFAVGSMLFFLAAAGATVFDISYGDRIGPSSRGQQYDATSLAELSPRSRAENVAGAKAWEKEKLRRLKILVLISIIFGASTVLLPTVQFIQRMHARMAWFYTIVTVFGATFGLGYSRFQDMTWRLLPSNCDMANAMGLNVMARNFGLGVGNFFFGALLESFKVLPGNLPDFRSRGWHASTTIMPFPIIQPLARPSEVYTTYGYDAMCIGCMLFNAVAGAIAYRITLLLPDPDAIAEAG